jgi:hypothetical protein
VRRQLRSRVRRRVEPGHAHGALDGLVARFGLEGQRLGDVVAVVKHIRDFNLTRECVLGSRLDQRVAAIIERPAGP